MSRGRVRLVLEMTRTSSSVSRKPRLYYTKRRTTHIPIDTQVFNDTVTVSYYLNTFNLIHTRHLL